jgi:hypothetical protein
MFDPYPYFKGKNVLLIGNGEKLANVNYRQLQFNS